MAVHFEGEYRVDRLTNFELIDLGVCDKICWHIEQVQDEQGYPVEEADRFRAIVWYDTYSPEKALQFLMRELGFPMPWTNPAIFNLGNCTAT